MVFIFGRYVSISAASATGKRPNNEDSVGWVAITKTGTIGEIIDECQIKNSIAKGNEILFCIVCDGMGGLENGKAVSSIVVKKSIEWVQKRVFDGPEDVFMGYRNYLYDLERELMQKYPKSGTTLVVLFGYKEKWFSMHIGDSRCYWLNGIDIERTRDHSPVEELLRSGLIEETEATNHPMKNVISAFIGGGYSSKLTLDEINGPEKIVLCTDGAFGYMSSDEFENSIRMIGTADEIVEKALSNGSADNISALVCKLQTNCSEKDSELKH